VFFVYERGMASRAHGRASAVLIAAAALVAAADAGAVDITGAGGMGLNIWPMAIDLAGTARVHQGVGLGINGRVMMKVGDHFRLQGGLLQGRFTEDDDSQVKRNLIFVAAEGVHAVSRRVYVSGGLRLGADHLSLVETLARDAPDTRLIRDAGRWSFLWHPFVMIGVLLGGKYHLELETGAAFDYVDSQVNTSYTITLGIYFGFGGE